MDNPKAKCLNQNLANAMFTDCLYRYGLPYHFFITILPVIAYDGVMRKVKESRRKRERQRDARKQDEKKEDNLSAFDSGTKL